MRNLTKRLLALALSLLFAAGGALPANAQQTGDSPVDQLLELTKHRAFTITGLMTVFGTIGDNEDIGGTRGFAVPHARLGVGGELDDGFHYRFQFDLARDPVLLDAYLGYRFSEGFNIRAGAQKPQISAEFIPTPAGIDFIGRARLVDANFRVREIGVNFFGGRGSLRYDVGIWNGTGLAATNADNRFMVTGRLANEFSATEGVSLLGGLNVAYGHCASGQCGVPGLPPVDRHRSLGVDLRYESDRWIAAGEVLATTADVVPVALDDDRLLGWHLTGGYKTSPETRLLVRWDRLERREVDLVTEDILLMGLNHDVSRLLALRFNLQYLLHDPADNELRFAGALQFAF
jgi:hypothetical protein